MKIGVLGAGSFGTAIANLLTLNGEVLVYARKQAVVDELNINHKIKGYEMSELVTGTTDLAELAQTCRLIFPIIPSEFFRTVMRQLAPHIGPGHILIHGTKGLDVGENFEKANSISEIKKSVFTMTEVIRQETSVIRTGALAGPNLAKEILAGQPAASVLASDFTEVIDAGRNALSSNKFIVYGSNHLKGVELAGALKNVIAIASGLLNGLKFGKNMQALLVTRGLREMIIIGQAVGAEARPFIGTAGIGDLIATATSEQSRNYTFGHLLSEDKSIDEIKEIMDEVAEGYRTIKFAYKIINAAKLDAPVIKTLYQIVYDGIPIRKAMIKLIKSRLSEDVDFL